ncbi:MAG TPA: NUDIX hydrolase [Acidimicrobiales bacterium]|nr:NUDIX hydrolase [Acidimicrobiales bacterium]
MPAALLTADHPALAPTGDLAVARATVAAVSDPALRPERARILGLIDACPDALVRTCRPGHLTGSALVVDPSRAAVLVLFHRKLQRWLQPGGHADGDANLAGVALREATEETGIAGLAVLPVPIDLDVHRVAPPAEDAHDHHDVRFLVVAPAGAAAVGNHESEALRWVGADELAGVGADAGLLRLARRALIEVERLALGR